MKTHENFTSEEQALLSRYVTNTDKTIFVLTNLPEVIKGALFSRYSRSTLGLRQLLLREFIQNEESEFHAIQGTQSSDKNQEQSILAIERAQNFYDRILDGYGDDSIGELGGAHLALENISILATKIIEDCRIGGSPLEKSTRYVDFSQKVNGDYLFYKNSRLLESHHKDRYLEINRYLFDTYTSMIEPVTKFVEYLMPRTEGVNDAAYKRSVKAKALDLLRGLLPASTMTNMGVYGNGRFFETLISKMHVQEIGELQHIGQDCFEELSKVIPSFIRRSHPEHRHFKNFQEFFLKNRTLIKSSCNRYLSGKPTTTSGVQLVDYDTDAENKLLTALLYPHTELSMTQLMEIMRKLPLSEKVALIDQHANLREHRRHKPGRALEQIFYTFDIVGDYGMYRDLQRHRMLTQERQLLSTHLGYITPPEIEHSRMAPKYHEAMSKAAEVYEKIAEDFPVDAQYVVPLAYNIRWFMHINLRSLMWLVELRSTPQGHESYRKIAQSMYHEIERAHPLLIKYLKFTDLKEYTLGRLDSEIRQEQKNDPGL
ncbi:MAG: FAD-dependent thymidylate synthase [SAR324 cluster bacterium]|nr:FAD-dependent thymidylate synthase [SAR324 cluster bacterium]